MVIIFVCDKNAKKIPHISLHMPENTPGAPHTPGSGIA